MAPTIDNSRKPAAELEPRNSPGSGSSTPLWQLRKAALIYTTSLSGPMSSKLRSLAIRTERLLPKANEISASNSSPT